MELAVAKKREGLSSRILFFVWLATAFSGAVGQGIFEKSAAALGSADRGFMALATAAVILRAVSAVGIPIAAFTLHSRMSAAGSLRLSFLYLLLVALVSEIPYDLSHSGRLLETDSQNPLFGLCICVAMAGFFSKFEKNTVIKVSVILFSVIWALILSVDDGVLIVLAFGVITALRKKESIMPFVLAVALSLGTVLSPYYAIAPFGAALVHGQREEREERLPVFLYPIMLLAVWLVRVILKEWTPLF